MYIDTSVIGNLTSQFNTGLSQIQSVVNQTGQGGVVTTPQPTTAPIKLPAIAGISPLVWIGIALVVIIGIIISKK